MFQYLRLRWEIWRLNREWAAEVRGTYKAVQAAKARNASDEELKEIAGGSRDYVWRQRVLAAQTIYLLAQADRLIVPVPGFFDEKMWEHHDGDRHFLTEAGFAELRAAIRAEKRLGLRRQRLGLT